MRKRIIIGYIVVGCLMTMATAWAIQSQLTGEETQAVIDTQATGNPATANPSLPSKIHPVVIRKPTPPAGVDTGRVDYHGNAVRLECRSCHDVRSPNTKTAASANLKQFHQGLVFNHGKLACAACHNPKDGYTTLHLADGSSVTYADTMQLCAQCHGPQFRDYEHGTHGGMTGYWDLTKGPRQRNHCVDCHDPHSPQYPMVHPAPGPNDRFAPSHKDIVH